MHIKRKSNPGAAKQLCIVDIFGLVPWLQLQFEHKMAVVQHTPQQPFQTAESNSQSPGGQQTNQCQEPAGTGVLQSQCRWATAWPQEVCPWLCPSGCWNLHTALRRKMFTNELVICMKKNEQVVNKALPVRVHNPVTCMVSPPIYLLPPPQDTGAIGNCALRKICSLHLQPEIRSKPVKIHGKNMWIFVSVRKGLEKAWHFSLAFSFGVFHHQPLVLIRVLPKAHNLAAHTPLCKCCDSASLSLPYSDPHGTRSQALADHCRQRKVPCPRGDSVYCITSHASVD